MILSLQNDQMLPGLMKTQEDYDAMENRVESAMVKHNLTYLELLRKVAISCDEFVLFVREKKYPADIREWPQKCGEIFLPQPIFTPFGTCFKSNPNYELT